MAVTKEFTNERKAREFARTHKGITEEFWFMDGSNVYVVYYKEETK